MHFNRGVDLSACDYKDQTPLLVSTANNKGKVAKIPLKSGSRTCTALKVAYHSFSVVVLSEAGDNVYCRASYSGKKGNTQNIT